MLGVQHRTVPALVLLPVSIVTVWLSVVQYYLFLSTKSLCRTRSISACSRTLYRDTGRGHTSCTHFDCFFSNELIKMQLRLISWHNTFK